MSQSYEAAREPLTLTDRYAACRAMASISARHGMQRTPLPAEAQAEYDRLAKLANACPLPPAPAPDAAAVEQMRAVVVARRAADRTTLRERKKAGIRGY